MMDAFKKYLRDTYNDEFDDQNFDHMIKLAVFEAGWDSCIKALAASLGGKKK